MGGTERAEVSIYIYMGGLVSMNYLLRYLCKYWFIDRSRDIIQDHKTVPPRTSSAVKVQCWKRSFAFAFPTHNVI